jgi:hypothetical protein
MVKAQNIMQILYAIYDRKNKGISIGIDRDMGDLPVSPLHSPNPPRSQNYSKHSCPAASVDLANTHPLTSLMFPLLNFQPHYASSVRCQQNLTVLLN